ncbi:unnamed protein product [Vitrella brassicaformis CCMP3155]|uniref:Rho-GAP domain-containing protein n=1 Tax=Vitrella brassicaformis (strain CCMP3155) TaxID=1169540 RepID=A0A0G4GN80_VITBC|nr:unnamed protein product [Vitrella brassicaformis CCMP3155]|eukprot:CEM31648.1 unnamed protein product [Vitrella brassicaformis CCMP3155]
MPRDGGPPPARLETPFGPMPNSEQERAVEEQYRELLIEAQREDFEDFDQDRLLRRVSTDDLGRPVVMLIGGVLSPDVEELERAFLYVVKTLDGVVDRPYVVVYCHTHVNWLSPSLYSFIQSCHTSLPRKYRKNLTQLYVVHATLTFRTLMNFATAFVSSKFFHKIEYIERLGELSYVTGLPAAQLQRLFPYSIQRYEAELHGVTPLRLFGTPLEVLADHLGVDTDGCSQVPEPIVRLVNALSDLDSLKTRRLFFLQSDSAPLYSVVRELEEGVMLPDMDEVCAVAVAFKLFLNSLPEPLLTFNAFTTLERLKDEHSPYVPREVLSGAVRQLLMDAPPINFGTVKFLLGLLSRVANCARFNEMSIKKLAEVFAPAFFRPADMTPEASDVIQVANEAMAVLLADQRSLLADVEISMRSGEGRETAEGERRHRSRAKERKRETSADARRTRDSEAGVINRDVSAVSVKTEYIETVLSHIDAFRRQLVDYARDLRSLISTGDSLAEFADMTAAQMRQIEEELSRVRFPPAVEERVARHRRPLRDSSVSERVEGGVVTLADGKRVTEADLALSVHGLI